MLCAVHDQRDKNAVTNAAAVLADWDPLRASTMRCMAFYCSCSVISRLIIKSLREPHRS